MTHRLLLPILGLALLSGCASRSERDALRGCKFAPRGTTRLGGSEDSLRLSIAVEIRNPGPSAAILDSFVATVSSGMPIGVLSHGGTSRILPGTMDTVAIHLSVESANLMTAAASFVFSPPDSLRVAGTAWMPGWFGLRAHPVRVVVPYASVAGGLKRILGGGLGQP
jgi:hypothetical protein